MTPMVPTDSERLWAAMLQVFPVIINDSLKHAPEGCAQLCREHAQALLAEWHKSHGDPMDPMDNA